MRLFNFELVLLHAILGVLIYEMVVGYPPFYDDNPFGIYEKILSGKIEWSRHIEPIAKDLVKKLLVQDRTKRLGNMKVGLKPADWCWFRSKINAESFWVYLFDCRMEPMISRGIDGSSISIGMS